MDHWSCWLAQAKFNKFGRNFTFLQYLRCNIFARAGRGHSGLAGGHSPPWPPLATGLLAIWPKTAFLRCEIMLDIVGRPVAALSRRSGRTESTWLVVFVSGTSCGMIQSSVVRRKHSPCLSGVLQKDRQRLPSKLVLLWQWIGACQSRC